MALYLLHRDDSCLLIAQLTMVQQIPFALSAFHHVDSGGPWPSQLTMV